MQRSLVPRGCRLAQIAPRAPPRRQNTHSFIHDEAGAMNSEQTFRSIVPWAGPDPHPLGTALMAPDPAHGSSPRARTSGGTSSSSTLRGALVAVLAGGTDTDRDAATNETIDLTGSSNAIPAIGARPAPFRVGLGPAKHLST